MDEKDIVLAQRIRNYEVVMVLSPEATEEEISSAVERVNQLIKDKGGEMVDHELWGLKRLAFPIMKFREGNYILIKFSLDSNEVPELNRNLTAAQDIIRFLITKN